MTLSEYQRKKNRRPNDFACSSISPTFFFVCGALMAIQQTRKGRKTLSPLSLAMSDQFRFSLPSQRGEIYILADVEERELKTFRAVLLLFILDIIS